MLIPTFDQIHELRDKEMLRVDLLASVTLLVARMKRPFIQNIYKIGAIRIIDDGHFFSRIAHALILRMIKYGMPKV